MSRINLHSMQILASIATSGSLTKAADEMHMTPSAVSKRIAELESRFGTPLLMRRSTGVKLTAAGAIVVRYAQDIVLRVAEMSSEISALLLQQSGEVRIMSNTTAILLGLLEDIAQFRVAHPGIRILVTEGGSNEVIESVKQHQSDIGVCVKVEAVRGLAYETYRQTELAVVLPHGHALGSREIIVTKDLSAYHIIWSPPSTRLGRAVLTSPNESLGDVKLSIRSFDVVFRSVRQGSGLAVVPYAAIASGIPAGLAVVRLKPDTAFEVVICHDATIHSDPATQQLLAWLRSRAEPNGEDE